METEQTTNDSGQWAILELMGRKVVAGFLTRDDWQGHAMLRIDVPATSVFPAFTQIYGPQAVYCITYVSEDVARMTAEQTKANPVAVYVPDLAEMQRAQLENERLRQENRDLYAHVHALPQPHPDNDDDGRDDIDF